MRILGIDTATSTASVALIVNRQIVSERTHPSGKSLRQSAGAPRRTNHAEIIIALIDGVLSEAAVSLKNLDAFAVSIGPGSFTGLRIGLSTVKGLAYGLTTPVIGISTLLANAARVDNFVGLLCSTLDARKREVYAAFFRRGSDELTRLTEDRVMDATEAVKMARIMAEGASCLFLGDGAAAYEKVIMEEFGGGACVSTGDSYRSVAAMVALLGEHRLRAVGGNLPAPSRPVYLRRSEAEVKRGNGA